MRSRKGRPRRGWRMQCRNVLTRIDALRTRELAPIEKSAVEEHLRTCRSCDASQDDVEQLVHAVKSLALVPPVSCKDECRAAIADSFDRVGEASGAFTRDRVRMSRSGEAIDDVREPYAKKCGRVLEPGTIPGAPR